LGTIANSTVVQSKAAGNAFISVIPAQAEISVFLAGFRSKQRFPLARE
jgi:hypothetical protein